MGDDASNDDALPPAGPTGRRLATAAAGLFGLTVLALLWLVVRLLAAADEPFVDQPTIENPLSGWLALLSLTASGLAMLGYAAWSFRRQRRLRAAIDREPAGPLSRVRGTLAALNAEPEALDSYERRVKRSWVSLLMAGMLLALPVSIVLPS